MTITTGIIFILISMRMRSWGRKNYIIPDMFKKPYQTHPLFWLTFSVIGMAFFIGGCILVAMGLLDKS